MNVSQQPSSPSAEAEAGGADRQRASRVAGLTIGLWVSCLALVATLAAPQHWWAGARWQWWIAFPALAAAFALAEIFVVHVRMRADAHTFSLVELPLALGLFFTQPIVLIAAQLVGAGAALVLHRRQGVLKLCFNTGAFAFTTVVAIGVFRWLAPQREHLGPGLLLKGGGALLCEALLAVLLVFAVISLATGQWRLTDLRASLLHGAATATFTASMGIVAAVVIDAQPGVGWVLAIPTIGAYLASRAFNAQTRRHEGLDFLHRSTQLLHESPELETAVVQLLRHACETFNAASAELVYCTDSGEEAIWVRVGPGDEASVARELLEAHRELLGVVDTRAACIVQADGEGAVADLLRATGHQTGIVAPLLSERRLAGVLMIVDRLSQVVNFDATDARLAETLANHTMTALENGRLEQSLEELRVLEGNLTFQVLHDPLTGLANRTLFRTELSSAIERRDLEGGHGAAGAVVFVDLDEFKTVNDSFGHATGDDLLVEAARRLKESVGDAIVARLGGDEFAVLLPAVADQTGALEVAERIMRNLGAPTTVAAHRLGIRASVGIALIEPGVDPESLMRSADTAMYTAKAQGKHRVVVFEPSMFESSIHRFNLHSDLQRAVQAKALSVHFQPIVRFQTRAIVGAEALVRWDHPRLGPLTPEAFLPTAEQTGLISAVDMLVLDAACAWIAGMEVADPGLVPRVFVNLSPRSFHEPGLVEHVLSALRRNHLAPSQLGIEVTEQLMVEHVEQAVQLLTDLKAIGVHLVLDNFGTGPTSLSCLQTLPVDVVKITKPFLDGLEASESQRALTSAIVALGSALDKTVVAEGVERPEQLDLLASFGCDTGQGYYFARPMHDSDFLAWARKWAGTTGSGVPGPSLARVRQLRPGAPLVRAFDSIG
ncbi:MAG: EAL domain-containing protein [Actinomycetota bacterium]|nr:EAL domain-containing protein [Actinomycetota bacterium]